jgi:hypothetical protein
MKGTNMANKKVSADRGNVDRAISAASAVITRDAPDKSSAEIKMIPVRINEIDYNRFKGLFGSQGLALATAARLAIYYVGELVESGAITINTGGIIDRRGEIR